MKHDSFPPPCAERLAAYFDGTLPEHERRAVENWLRENPEVAADFNGLRQLREIVRAASVPEPSEEAWAAVRGQIERGLQKSIAAKKRRSVGTAVWWAAAAAGIVLTTLLPVWRAKPRVPETVEVLPIASAEDVEIVSVDAAGVRALLVGEPPLQTALVLMAAGDAKLKSVEIPPAGQFPEVWMGPGEQESPMIVAPVVSGQLSTP